MSENPDNAVSLSEVRTPGEEGAGSAFCDAAEWRDPSLPSKNRG